MVATILDDHLLDALGHVSSGRRAPLPAQLYAAGNCYGGADLGSWWVTGPIDRPGYIRGPFPKSRIDRLVNAGAIVPDVVNKFGEAEAYVLPKFKRLAPYKSA